MPLPQGLVSYWSFNNTTNDIVGNNNPNNVINEKFLPSKKGMIFNPDNPSYIEIPFSASLANQRFTIEAWVEPRGLGKQNDKFGNMFLQLDSSSDAGDSVAVSLSWSVRNKKFAFIFGNTGRAIFSKDCFEENETYQVTATYDGQAFRLYVNGVWQAGKHTDIVIDYGQRSMIIGATSLRHHGADQGRWARTWNGVISTIRIYDRALVRNEIRGLYNYYRRDIWRDTGNHNDYVQIQDLFRLSQIQVQQNQQRILALEQERQTFQQSIRELEQERQTFQQSIRALEQERQMFQQRIAELELSGQQLIASEEQIQILQQQLEAKEANKLALPEISAGVAAAFALLGIAFFIYPFEEAKALQFVGVLPLLLTANFFANRLDRDYERAIGFFGKTVIPVVLENTTKITDGVSRFLEGGGFKVPFIGFAKKAITDNGNGNGIQPGGVSNNGNGNGIQPGGVSNNGNGNGIQPGGVANNGNGNGIQPGGIANNGNGNTATVEEDAINWSFWRCNIL